MDGIYYLAGFALLISIIVFVHEYGHYLAGRLCGVGVEVFSIGFGKRIISYLSKSGTRWQISAIPLGGYVSFRGDVDPSSTKYLEDDNPPDAFHVQPLWKRMIIIAAGPFANFLLAYLLIASSLMLLGKIEYPARVDRVIENSPAATAGFQKGDWIISIDDNEIGSFREVKRIIALSANDPVMVVVKRDDTDVTLKLTPEKSEIDDGSGGKIVIGKAGLAMIPDTSDRQHIKYSLPEALVDAGKETWSIVEDTGRFARRLFYDEDARKQISGPLRIAKISGDTVQKGSWDFIQLIVVLSISVGLLNLLPLPILDGGHLLMGLYEMISGKRPSPQVTGYAYQFGGVVLAGLFLFALLNDLQYLKAYDSLVNLFT